MAEAKLAERDVTKKMLEDAANDINRLFETPIDTGKKVTKAMLQADIIEAAKELQPDDILLTKTVEVLKVLGAQMPVKEEAEEPVAEGTVDEKGPETEVVAETAPNTGGGEARESMQPSKAQKNVTRIKSVCMVLQRADGIAKEGLIAESDALYARNGGKANEKEAKWSVKIVLDVLESAGVLTVADGKYSLI